MGRERRLTGLVHHHVIGREDRQLVVGHGHDPVVRAVDDRNRTAPEALARDQPVAQAVVDLGVAVRVLGEELGRARLRRGDVETVQESGVDLRAVAGEGAAVEAVGHLRRVHDGQTVGEREGVVALVLPGHGHDRAGAVGAEHVVRHVDRHRLAVEGIDRRSCR